MKKTKRFQKLFIIFILFIIILTIFILIKPYMPNFQKIDYKESLNLEQDDVILLFNNDNVDIESKAIIEDDEIFLPVDFIKKYVDEYIFWDENENKLTITTENNVIRMQTEELEYFVNNEPLSLDVPIYNIDSIAYIPYSFLKEFYSNFDFEIISSPSLKTTVDIKQKDLEEKHYSLKRGAKLRTEPSEKAPIIAKYKDLILTNDVILVSEQEDFYKIKTYEGYVGYVNKRYLIESEINTNQNNAKEDTEAIEDTESTENSSDEKLIIVFDQVTTFAANRTESRRTYHEGVDVLVPTWFSFENTDGDIINIADKSYVEWAHQNGYEVWALLTDNFDSEISHAILSSTSVREHVIKQLLAFVSLYNLDGINIDFESVPTDDGDYYIQFLRELAPLLKQQGTTLSVDLFVPKPWTEHYQREEVGKIVDYAIVMGYDEHYSGSETSGSVASISWSNEAIVSSLKENIPNEKLILGIPFYTRIWTEITLEDGTTELYSKAYAMEDAYNFIIDKEGEFVWLEDMGQYYGEVTEGNTTYKVWLEEEESVKKRLELVLRYDIAGCAAWKRGLEKESIWSVLENTLK